MKKVERYGVIHWPDISESTWTLIDEYNAGVTPDYVIGTFDLRPDISEDVLVNILRDAIKNSKKISGRDSRIYVKH